MGPRAQVEFKGIFEEKEGCISPRDKKEGKREKDDPGRFWLGE